MATEPTKQEQPTPANNPPLSLDMMPARTPSKDDVNDSTPSSPSTPSPMARPPTPGGGPLSSHPATPVPTNDRYTPPPPADQDVQKADSVTATTSLEQPTPTRPAKHIPITEAAAASAAAASIPPSTTTSRPTSSHLNTHHTPIKTGVPARKPLTPASANAQSNPPISRRNSTGVRKLLSLTSLRSSFSSSRTSLAQQQPSPHQHRQDISSPTTATGKRRPASPSPSQTLSPQSPSTYQTYTASVSGGSPRQTSHNHNYQQGQTSPEASPRLRKRKSGGWFRRASMLMMLDGEDKSGLENVPENKEGNHTTKTMEVERGAQGRDPRSPGMPVLPELQGIGGQKVEGWGEDIFAGIGR